MQLMVNAISPTKLMPIQKTISLSSRTSCAQLQLPADAHYYVFSGNYRLNFRIRNILQPTSTAVFLNFPFHRNVVIFIKRSGCFLDYPFVPSFIFELAQEQNSHLEIFRL